MGKFDVDITYEMPDKPKELLTVEEIIQDPIACGFLLKFCHEGFCAENLEFWMAVDEFKDKCKSLDFYDEADARKCGAMVTSIWEEFLSENSKTEVSLPSCDRKDTIERMNNLEKYKDELFEIALKDPIKTLRKDIRPRFINSKTWATLISRKSEKGSEHIMPIKPPTKSLVDFDFPDNKVDFTIQEIVSDKYLYNAMVKFLKKRFCGENLFLCREIQYFEEVKDEGGDYEKIAWNIYRQFIAPGSPNEISCHNLMRKNIMLGLALPSKETFAELKAHSVKLLAQDYKHFRSSSEYVDALKTLKNEKKKKNKKK